MTSKISLFLASLAMVAMFSACDSEDYSNGSSSEKQYVHVDDIQIVNESMDFVMGINGTATLEAIVSPSTVSPQDLIWTSSNPAVVSVDNFGVLTAHSDGEAIITVSSQDYSLARTCKITVSHVKLTELKLDYDDYNMQEGAEFTLSVTKQPANAYYQNVTWRTTNSAVAVVSEGKVTAIRAGKADIIATNLDGLADTCHVTVASNTENVTFKPYEKVEW